MWMYCLVAALSLLDLCTGVIIAGLPGEDKVLKWTMDPVPPLSVVVDVLHPSGVIMFSALGTAVIPAGRNFSDRVTKTDNTNTTKGHIEFTLTGITTEDAGDYKTIYNLITGHEELALIIYGKPTKPIITEIVPLVVNDVMILNCTSNSNSQPEDHGLLMKYKWYINGSELSADKSKYNASGSYIEVRDIRKSDKQTVVTCRSYENINVLSDVSEGYTIKPKYGPDDVYLKPNNKSYVLVENIRDTLGPVVCWADCNPKCNYTWTWNNTVLDSQEGILTIDDVKRDKAGVYTCKAFYLDVFSESTFIKVVVEYPPDHPTLVKSSQGDIMENQFVSLTCTTDSVPLPSITIVSFNTSRKNVTTHVKLNNTLTIEKAECLDTGVYVCKANNTIGSRWSYPVPLNITCFPRPDHRVHIERDIYIGDDDNLNITAPVIANPAPVLSWSLSLDGTHNTTIKNNSIFIFYRNAKHVTYTSQVVKSSPEVGDYGRYTLTATNTYGDTEVSFNVIANRSTYPPYEGAVLCSSQTSAVVTWKSNFNGGRPQHFRVRTFHGIQDIESKRYDDKGINVLHEAIVEKLNHSTLYTFIIEAQNINGGSQIGEGGSLNCKTKPLSIECVTSAAVIGGAVGGSVAFIIILNIVCVTLSRKCRKEKKEDDTKLDNVGTSNVLQHANNYESLTERTTEEYARLGNINDSNGNVANEYMDFNAEHIMTSFSGNINEVMTGNTANEYMNIDYTSKVTSSHGTINDQVTGYDGNEYMNMDNNSNVTSTPGYIYNKSGNIQNDYMNLDANSNLTSSQGPEKITNYYVNVVANKNVTPSNDNTSDEMNQNFANEYMNAESQRMSIAD